MIISGLQKALRKHVRLGKHAVLGVDKCTAQWTCRNGSRTFHTRNIMATWNGNGGSIGNQAHATRFFLFSKCTRLSFDDETDHANLVPRLLLDIVLEPLDELGLLGGARQGFLLLVRRRVGAKVEVDTVDQLDLRSLVTG